MAVSSGAALTNPARHTRLDIARGRRQQRCAWGFPHEHGVRRWRGVGTHTAGAECALGCSDAAARRCSSRSLASVRRAATSLNSSLLCIVCSSMRASTTSATGSEDTSVPLRISVRTRWKYDFVYSSSTRAACVLSCAQPVCQVPCGVWVQRGLSCREPLTGTLPPVAPPTAR
jgi:hypothetical protein